MKTGPLLNLLLAILFQPQFAKGRSKAKYPHLTFRVQILLSTLTNTQRLLIL